jgi:pyroglutamyl-peptidase
MTTILVTGFGPFPGAPFNPTTPLVRRLARLRRPALHGVTVIGHVFPTGYATVDRDLPRLIAAHKPDALLMFGLATRAKVLRVELRARNAIALVPDAESLAPHRHAIAMAAPDAHAMPGPAQRLRSAIRAAGLPAALSHDAGHYLCNYLCWRAAEAAARPGNLRLAAFIHVPKVRRHARPRGAKRRRFAVNDLLRAGERLLIEIVAAARR